MNRATKFTIAILYLAGYFHMSHGMNVTLFHKHNDMVDHLFLAHKAPSDEAKIYHCLSIINTLNAQFIENYSSNFAARLLLASKLIEECLIEPENIQNYLTTKQKIFNLFIQALERVIQECREGKVKKISEKIRFFAITGAMVRLNHLCNIADKTSWRLRNIIYSQLKKIITTFHLNHELVHILASIKKINYLPYTQAKKNLSNNYPWLKKINTYTLMEKKSHLKIRSPKHRYLEKLVSMLNASKSEKDITKARENFLQIFEKIPSLVLYGQQKNYAISLLIGSAEIHSNSSAIQCNGIKKIDFACQTIENIFQKGDLKNKNFYEGVVKFFDLANIDIMLKYLSHYALDQAVKDSALKIRKKIFSLLCIIHEKYSLLTNEQKLSIWDPAKDLPFQKKSIERGESTVEKKQNPVPIIKKNKKKRNQRRKTSHQNAKAKLKNYDQSKTSVLIIEPSKAPLSWAQIAQTPKRVSPAKQEEIKLTRSKKSAPIKIQQHENVKKLTLLPTQINISLPCDPLMHAYDLIVQKKIDDAFLIINQEKKNDVRAKFLNFIFKWQGLAGYKKIVKMPEEKLQNFIKKLSGVDSLKKSLEKIYPVISPDMQNFIFSKSQGYYHQKKFVDKTIYIFFSLLLKKSEKASEKNLSIQLLEKISVIDELKNKKIAQAKLEQSNSYYQLSLIEADN